MSDSKALAIIPRSMTEVIGLSAELAKSALLPDALRGKAADIMASIMAGAELGLSPMAALRGIFVVKGKPVLSADTMVGVALGGGLAEYFSCIEESDTRVTYETKRRGAPKPQQCTWTIEDAKRAGLQGDNWHKYPRSMLKARCKAMLARDVYPDVLAGCYDPDELHEAPRPAEVIPDAVVVSESLDADRLLSAIVDARSEAALKVLLPNLKSVPKDSPAYATLKSAYAEQLEILRTAARDDGGEQ